MSQIEDRLPWSKEAFTEKLRAKGAYYHIHHPFHIAMNSGKCTKEQVQGWVANRFYYQISIPVKDANVMANCPDREIRRGWVQRILDHDGQGDSEGGIEAWIRLGEACGMKRDDITSLKYVLPGVRFAVDAYVNFARRAPWQEAVCSSLTELFAPEIHQKRLDNWPQYYNWIDKEGYFYFRKRLTEARRDVEQGLKVTLDYFTTREQQERALTILQFKLDVLWTMLDAMHLAYVADMPPYFNIPTQP
ncbi:pyrroloquinoline-quinone synthase PqqC [Beggiatoa leptomitoformis]|uniref:Pyrroloquinoline-quinone synthase n=1 Tax=Beggiatoa leptomitoformis TaxID=288004 RepID=A0A2N9YIP0_9GAMM|nr:pyrroloquinoline-quinone synthase PqqC [Beggiatoa leptomitoformis]ALG67549.1 pyrroloquinoline-quinone synthase PqqC [Beggiatoa leptomitoformis]AUI70225.1 pyrroloquinoline-quinone synthase PqqC [Beggiatoa leptomitoformis]